MKVPQQAHFLDTIGGMTDQAYSCLQELRKTRRHHITGGENRVRMTRLVKLYPPLRRPPELPER